MFGTYLQDGTVRFTQTGPLYDYSLWIMTLKLKLDLMLYYIINQLIQVQSDLIYTDNCNVSFYKKYVIKNENVSNSYCS